MGIRRLVDTERIWCAMPKDNGSSFVDGSPVLGQADLIRSTRGVSKFRPSARPDGGLTTGQKSVLRWCFNQFDLGVIAKTLKDNDLGMKWYMNQLIAGVKSESPSAIALGYLDRLMGLLELCAGQDARALEFAAKAGAAEKPGNAGWPASGTGQASIHPFNRMAKEA